MSHSRDALSRMRGRLRYRAQPRWIAPMLATLTEQAPPGGGWIYEPKLDGVRVLAYVTGGSVRLFSRNRRQVEGGYPELVEALSLAVRGDAVLDGEIVAPDPATGLSSFARLQQRMHLRDAVRVTRTGVSVELYLFDCLFYEGIDLTGMPLLDRKKVLRDVVWYDGKIRYTPYRTSGSAAMYREACARGAEGIIAKRAESNYVSGRSADWLKIKCVLQQEFVIGGYTAPQGAREHLGALLVGYYDGQDFVFAGKLGTGFDTKLLLDMRKRFDAIELPASPFTRATGLPKIRTHWVRPEVVVQVAFTEWTVHGKLRHPRLIGMRFDKDAREIVREQA